MNEWTSDSFAVVACPGNGTVAHDVADVISAVVLRLSVTNAIVVLAFTTWTFAVWLHDHTCNHKNADFYLFPKLKEHMKGLKFADDDDVICTASDWLEDQDQEFFYLST